MVPKALRGAGAIEVISRGLRKIDSSQALYPTAFCRAVGLLLVAKDSMEDGTVGQRILSCQCDVALCDAVAWADANSSIVFPLVHSNETPNIPNWQRVVNPYVRAKVDLPLRGVPRKAAPAIEILKKNSCLT